jgi:excisionase family DNA binding protein
MNLERYDRRPGADADVGRETMNSCPPQSRYLRPKQAAEYLSVSPRTLFNWRKCGYVRFRKIRSVVLFVREELDEDLGRFTQTGWRVKRRMLRIGETTRSKW